MPDAIDPFGDLFAGPESLLFLCVGLVVAALFFTRWVNGRFQQSLGYFMQVPAAAGLQALGAARRLLAHAGLKHVRVMPGTGIYARNQYHPLKAEITLTQIICTSNSVAAISIAAHEVGHAVQYAHGYRYARLRTGLARLLRVCFYLAIAAGVYAVVASATWFLWTSAALFAGCIVLTLVALPAEFDASRRGRQLLIEAGLVHADEQAGVDRVLRTAWLTYVGRAMQSVCGVLGLGLLLSYQYSQFGQAASFAGASLDPTIVVQVLALVVVFGFLRRKPARRSSLQAIEVNNAGNLLAEQGDLVGAIDHYTRAIKLNPRLAQAYCNRGISLARAGRLDDALADVNRALSLAPDSADALLRRAEIQLERKEHKAVLADLEKALCLVPENLPTIRLFQGSVWLDRGEYDRAIDALTEALTRGGHWPLARCNRALAYLRRGDYQLAMADCNEAIRLAPEEAVAYNNRGAVLLKVGDYAAALTDLRTANRLNPRQPNVYKNLAWLQATCPDAAFRNGTEAVANAKRALELAPQMRGEWLDILAAAHAEAGQFDLAVRAQEEVMASSASPSRAEQQARLELYRAGQPFRETASKDTVDTDQPASAPVEEEVIAV